MGGIYLKDEDTLKNHELVPTHEILDKKEAKKLVSSLNIVNEQLPQISVDDPAAVTIGAKAGDVLKITRNSQTAGTTDYFRFVVE